MSWAAGVLFTRDPVTMDDGHYVVNAVLGLGEGVVTGQVPSDSFTMVNRTLEIVSRKVVKKNAMVICAPDGGVAQVRVPEARHRVPALADHQLVELGRLAQQLTRLFSGHQDVEFTVEEGVVQLLQARSVTGIDDAPPFEVVWEDPADANYTWVRPQGHLGHGPFFRFQEDVMRNYTEGSRACFQDTGAPLARYHIVRLFSGYMYARDAEVDEAELRRRQKRYLARDRAFMEQGTSSYEAEISPQVEQVLADLANFRPVRASLPALMRHLEHACQAFGHVMGDLHWRMAAGFRLDWPSSYHQITGEPEVASGALLQAIPNKTTQLVRRLRNLARLVQRDPELSAVFRERSYSKLRDPSLRNRPAVKRFRARLRRLLGVYGLRTGRGFGAGVGFTAPTWNMDPSQPLELIASYAQHDLDALERKEAQARRSRDGAKRRVRRLLASDPERLQRFDKELTLAVVGVKRMENHNHIMEQGVAGALREAIHWTGQGLVRQGLIDDPSDVLHFSMAELEAIADGGGPSDLRALARKRAEEFQSRAGLRPPATLGHGRPAPPDPRSILDLPSDAGLDGQVVRGVGASPGRATGRARVALNSSAPPHVEPGDILVANNAGPAWTPIMPLLGGLVLDEGAVFQHAALVAREYGIPAVIMTRDATTVILDGQLIGVDADQGVVQLVP